MRVVLDTNIFISGIFWSGNFCSKILDAWRSGKFTLISSIPIVEELVKTLKEFKIRMPDERIKEWESMIVENASMVEPTIKLDIVEHEEDNRFFEAAFAGQAEYIVSQDNHLLKVGDYKSIRVLLPQEFLELL